MLLRAVPVVLATLGLAAAGPAAVLQTADTPAFVALCGDPRHRIPVPGRHDDKPHNPCPMGCHAVCPRRDGTDDEE